MRILGIDPGIGRVGWGVIESQKSKVKSQKFGCIETPKTASVEQRLEEIYSQVVQIIGSEKPEVLAIEELFFNTNVTTALTVGQARGVIFLAATQHNLPIAVYKPQEVKVAVTGYGKADKQQVGRMVKTILKLASVPKPDDTADALAIAITHAFSYKMHMLQ